MSVNIEGVQVHNPTAVWMQLKATRTEVLDRADRWNPGGWFEHSVLKPGGQRQPFTMCLANALRYVTRGYKDEPGDFSREHDLPLDQAEMIVLAAINKTNVAKRQGRYRDIPGYNDGEDRRFEEVVAVLETAIDMVAPYAKTHAVTFAEDVLTDDERAEMRIKIREAEDEIWSEAVARWDLRTDSRGRWRTGAGRFFAAPRHLISRDQVGEIEPPSSDEVGEFKDWLSNHEKRGWATFWDELIDCPEGDEVCREAQVRAGRKPVPQAKPVGFDSGTRSKSSDVSGD